MLIAQISDPHIGPPGSRGVGGVDCAAHLMRCVAHINASSVRPDIVVATGDLVGAGGDEEYRVLRRTLDALDMPLYVLPGNHDERSALRRHFADHEYLPRDGEFLHYTVDTVAPRLIMLDTHVPGEPGGLMCAERLAWLSAALEQAPDRPTLVFMHHPPCEIGIASMDAMRCRGGEAMGLIVERHGRVERILCGHVHRPVHIDWHGTVVATAPSTAVQLALDLDDDAPLGWSEDEPPAYLLHWWRPQTGLITHFCPVPNAPGT